MRVVKQLGCVGFCVGLSVLLAACGLGSNENNGANSANADDVNLLPIVADQGNPMMAANTGTTGALFDYTIDNAKVADDITAIDTGVQSTAQASNGTGATSNVVAAALGSQGVLTPTALAASVTNLAQHCDVPRAGSSDVQGSLETEMQWIAAFNHFTYLWYQDVQPVSTAAYRIGNTVPFINPSNNQQSDVELVSAAQVANGTATVGQMDVVSAYFNTQRTTALTASGKPVDQFHFTAPTNPVIAGQSTGAPTPSLQFGTSFGLGMELAILSPKPPRQIVVAYPIAGSPAYPSVEAAPRVPRGTQIMAVNGIRINFEQADPNWATYSTTKQATISETNLNIINQLFDPLFGATYQLDVILPGAQQETPITIIPAIFNQNTIPAVSLAKDQAGRWVGYLAFTEFIKVGELNLFAAFNQLKNYNLSGLVLDLRYNSGGLVNLASELAYMISGVAPTEVFADLKGNGQYLDANTKQNFTDTTIFYGNYVLNKKGELVFEGVNVPTLGLKTVTIITGPDTCSASEALINGLIGAGINVVEIGTSTCGKPYAFVGQDNCGTTFYTVQSQSFNAKGFGDFQDGFIPTPTANVAQGNLVPGCIGTDDFTHPLGNREESLFKTALAYHNTGSCPAYAASSTDSGHHQPLLVRSPERTVTLITAPGGKP